MKDQITLIMKTSILPVLACIAAVTIFTACEPEGVEDQIVEMDLRTGIQAKAAAPALLKKELALLRATVAPWHDFDTAFEAGYNLEVTGYRSQMGFHYLNPGLLDDTFEIDPQREKPSFKRVFLSPSTRKNISLIFILLPPV